MMIRKLEQHEKFDARLVMTLAFHQRMEDPEKEKRMQQAVLEIRKRFGKNAILRGMNFEEGATARDRNAQIGGHKA